MGNLDYKQYTKRRRPHIHPADATLFLTYRLAGSIPKVTVRSYLAKKAWLEGQLRRAQRMAAGQVTSELGHWVARIEKFHRECFAKFENILHHSNDGPMWMKNESVAETVADSLHRMDGEAYRLDAYSVMSNHVHAVFKPFLSQTDLIEMVDDARHPMVTSEHPGLAKITHSLKGRSARECNLILGRTGSFWEHESFDHVIRPGKFMATIRYVLNNPVKAGLVRHWRDWRWNYCRNELIGMVSDKP